jgi:Tfp pilus assembly protein PilO
MPEAHEQDTPGSMNPGWRKWQIYSTMLMMVVTMGTIIFRAGFSGATEEAKVERLEAEQLQMKQDFARKDVIEQRLLAMEEAQARIERAADRQAQLLEELLVQVKRGR